VSCQIVKKNNGLKNSIFAYSILGDRHNMYLYFGHTKHWSVRLALIRSQHLGSIDLECIICREESINGLHAQCIIGESYEL
jgi:hypothetical protein